MSYYHQPFRQSNYLSAFRSYFGATCVQESTAVEKLQNYLPQSDNCSLKRSCCGQLVVLGKYFDARQGASAFDNLISLHLQALACLSINCKLVHQANFTRVVEA